MQSIIVHVARAFYQGRHSLSFGRKAEHTTRARITAPLFVLDTQLVHELQQCALGLVAYVIDWMTIFHLNISCRIDGYAFGDQISKVLGQIYLQRHAGKYNISYSPLSSSLLVRCQCTQKRKLGLLLRPTSGFQSGCQSCPNK